MSAYQMGAPGPEPRRVIRPLTESQVRLRDAQVDARKGVNFSLLSQIFGEIWCCAFDWSYLNLNMICILYWIHNIRKMFGQIQINCHILYINFLLVIYRVHPHLLRIFEVVSSWAISSGNFNELIVLDWGKLYWATVYFWEFGRRKLWGVGNLKKKNV